MSTQTLPEMPGRPPEIAPSQVAVDEPSAARAFGLIGMMIAVLGLTVVVFNAVYGPRIIGPEGGILFIAFGLLGMLFHALRDTDMQIRRAYGVIGMALVGITALFALVRVNLFVTYGWATAIAAFCFLLTNLRHETDAGWIKRLTRVLGITGAVAGGVGLLGCLFITDFAVTYGILLAVLGLIYLCGFVSQQSPVSEVPYRVGLALGMTAVFLILYALLRSILPAVLKMSVAPFFVPTGLLLLICGMLYGMVALSLVSDSRFVVLAKRELTGYFYSPIAYLVMIGMVLMGWTAYYFFVNFIKAGGIRIEPIVLNYFQDFPPIVILVLVPAITMRLLAEEKRSGTYEVLMCAPVKESTVVLSKHVAALIFFMLLWGIWALFLISLRVESGNDFDYRPLLSFYFALLLCGSSFISMGLFFSALSGNQIVGAVLTFMGLLLVTILGSGFVQRLESVGPLWKAVFSHLSYSELWVSSLKGRMHVREMILQGSFTFFWLFLTVKVLEARRWS